MKKTSRETINDNVWCLRELLHNVIRGHRVKAVAAELGKPEKTLGHEVNEYNTSHKFEWTELYRFTSLMGDFTVLDVFEQKLGRIAVELEHFNTDIDENTLFDNLTDCLCQLGKLGKEIKKARHIDSDQGEEITTKELDRIEKQAFGLIRIILSILAQLEPDITNFKEK